LSDLNIAYTEQYVLSCLLNKKELIEECPNYFISNIGKSFYLALKLIIEKDLSFSDENLVLMASKSLSPLTLDKIEIIRSFKTEEKDFKTYIQDLKESFIKNELKTKVIKDLVVSVEVQDKNLDKIVTHLDDAYKLIQEINKKEVIGISLNEALEKYKTVIINRSKEEEFYPTGIGLLDQHNSLGFHPKYMTTIFGKSGVGKTTVGLGILNAGINRYIPSVYDSLEMDLDLVLDKLISSRTGIPFDILMRGKDETGDNIADYLVDMIEAERLKIQSNRRIMLVDESSQSISDLDYEIPSWKKFMGVDYFVLHLDLSTMLSDYGNGRDNTASQYELALNKLHSLARKHNIHIVHYVQSQRDSNAIKIEKVEDIAKFRPTLANIKNSSAFEERSRVVLGLHREKYYADRYLPDDPQTSLLSSTLEVQFLKNSMGRLPTLDFYFDGATSKILPIIKEKIERSII